MLDFFNPKFVYHSPVHVDELRDSGILSTARIAAHVDHAIAAFNAADGTEPRFDGDARVEYLNPVSEAAPMRIDLWVDALDAWSCTYGFICSSEDGRTPYARGERTVVNAGAKQWPEEFRSAHATLVRNLPAYA